MVGRAELIEEHTRNRLWGVRQVRWARLLVASFLVYVVAIVIAQLGSGGPVIDLVAVAAMAGGLIGVYLRVVWQNMPTPHGNRTPVALTVLIALAGGLTPLIGVDWLIPGSYYSLAGLVLSLRRRWWLPSLAGVLAGAHVLALPFDLTAEDRTVLTLQIAGYAVVLMGFYQLVQLVIELGAARADLARFAVSDERLRFSRDLHDLLGHRLSASVLKAQLAARLVHTEPDRAATEASEAAALARGALDDVRAAVSGYRRTNLTEELETAEMLFAAAGLTLSVERDEVPGHVEEVAGWVVREATTNVVRHARARSCQIGIQRGTDCVRIGVSDDGLGAQAGWGNGLTGLAERVSALGGELSTVHKDGRFTVLARIPT